jgi:diguanylate cyclase (GGDEF)-like protein
LTARQQGAPAPSPPGGHVEGGRPWGQPPRLVLRFALYTAVGLALAAGCILLFVRHFERGRAEQAATEQTRILAQLLGDRLTAADVGGPVTGARLATLDRLFSRGVLGEHVLRVELYDPRAQVTYSSDRRRIGRPAGEPGLLAAALAGSTVGRLTTVEQPTGTATALEAYAPVRVGGERAGVLGLSRDYAPIAAAARRALWPVVLVFELVLFGLYLSLFPILRRVTDRLRRQLAVIEHQALHDSLTRLPNRASLESSLTAALADGGEARLAVLHVELDGFRDVNETLGHSCGDELLRELGRRLEQEAPGRVARLGGDEFGVLACEADADEALELASRLAEAIGRPCEVGGVRLELQAAIGIALAPDNGGDAGTLLRRAGVAAESAKDGREPELYAPERDRTSPARLALAGELRAALDADELLVYFQPQVDLRDGSIVGAEALVRWRHPERGFLSPDEFLAVADQAGFMRPLTRRVLEHALRHCGEWHAGGHALGLSVNVSARDLVDSRLPEEVAQLLDEQGLAPAVLQLEITERTLLADPARTVAVLERLRALGVRIAIDDFGTGYSSLSALTRLPVDVLKIDRSFVSSMETVASHAVIVGSTIELARGLGLEVVAEGVENDRLLRRLAELGCDVAQGYCISRPLPAHTLTTWLGVAGPDLAARLHGPLRLAPPADDPTSAAQAAAR